MSGAAVERYRVYADDDLLPPGPLFAGQIEVVKATDHDAAIAALTAELQQCRPQWQPIETAPKDGTSILVAGGTWDRNDGYYGDLRFPGVEIARWLASYQHWRGSDVDAHDEWMVHKPAHWMPLPEPPSAALKERT